MPIKEIDQITRECIEACTSCHNICQETTTYCLEQGGKHVEPSHMRLMLDCVEICNVATNYMLARSDFTDDICKECADICDACAESCEEFTGDRTMLNCAEACRRCAEACRKMVTYHRRIAA